MRSPKCDGGIACLYYRRYFTILFPMYPSGFCFHWLSIVWFCKCLGYAATKQSTIKAIALKTFHSGGWRRRYVQQRYSGCGQPHRKFAGCCAMYKQQGCCRLCATMLSVQNTAIGASRRCVACRTETRKRKE